MGNKPLPKQSIPGWVTHICHEASICLYEHEQLKVFVKLEELHIVTARKPLVHQNHPVARYLHKKTAMYVVVYAGRLTAQNSIVEIINW